MKNDRKSVRARLFGLSVITLLVLPLSVVADQERGRLLYENHCAFCHASSVHIREQRKARTSAELRAAIQHWSDETRLKWKESDINDVQLYLNNRYYHFAPEAAPR